MTDRKHNLKTSHSDSLFKITDTIFFKYLLVSCFKIKMGSGALNGKMLLVRIIESNKINVIYRSS